MRVSTSPEFFEAIANHPAVFPAVSRRGQQRVEFGEAWPSLLGLEFDGGGWLLQRHAMGYYEVHTLFLPGATGLRRKAREAMRYLFCATDALEIVTRVPDDIPAALGLAKAMGMTERFRRESAWPRESGDVGMTYLGITLDEWARNAPELRELGEQAHAEIERVHRVTHDDDPIHDTYVGLGVACALAGQPAKGAWLYNRWAVFAGYEPVAFDGEAVYFDGVALKAANGQLTVERQGCPQQP